MTIFSEATIKVYTCCLKGVSNDTPDTPLRTGLTDHDHLSSSTKCSSSVIIWKVSPPDIPNLQRAFFVQALPYSPVCYILVSHNAVQFEDVRFCHRGMSRSANSRTGIEPFLSLGTVLLWCHENHYSGTYIIIHHLRWWMVIQIILVKHDNNSWKIWILGDWWIE